MFSNFTPHWNQVVVAWQQRPWPLWSMPKALFRNADQRDFYNARDGLFRDAMLNLILKVDIHLDEIVNSNNQE